VYRALIRSVLDYGSVAYSNIWLINKRRLDTIQYKALRIACRAFCTTPTQYNRVYSTPTYDRTTYWKAWRL